MAGDLAVGTRRALIFATSGRYLTLMLQIATSFFVAHHVLPDQFGLTVLGGGVLLAATALRDLGTTGYLVQDTELDPHKVRSAFTLSLTVTVLMTALLALSAPAIARFYDDLRLTEFLYLVAIAYAFGPFVNPIVALLSRDMAFQRIAVIDVGAMATGALTTIVLVVQGVGFMSVGWGLIARAVAAMTLSLAIKHDAWMFRPSLRAWRSLMTYGFHGSATAMIYTFGEALIYLLLGKLLDARAVGLIQRAYLLTQVPERVLLAGVGAVVVPTFGRLARNGEPLVEPYTHGLRLIAPVYLFAMLALIALAEPIVEVLLGSNWGTVVPLLQLIAAGHLVGLGIILNGGVLVAVGGIRRTAPLALFQMSLTMVTTIVAAPFGLLAIAATAFVTLPLCAYASYRTVREFIPFSWSKVSRVGFEGAVPAIAGTLPMLLPMAFGWYGAYPLATLMAVSVLGTVTWLAALRVLRHPLFDEIARVLARVVRRSALRPQG